MKVLVTTISIFLFCFGLVPVDCDAEGEGEQSLLMKLARERVVDEFSFTEIQQQRFFTLIALMDEKSVEGVVGMLNRFGKEDPTLVFASIRARNLANAYKFFYDFISQYNLSESQLEQLNNFMYLYSQVDKSRAPELAQLISDVEEHDPDLHSIMFEFHVEYNAFLENERRNRSKVKEGEQKDGKKITT